MCVRNRFHVVFVSLSVPRRAAIVRVTIIDSSPAIVCATSTIVTPRTSPGDGCRRISQSSTRPCAERCRGPTVVRAADLRCRCKPAMVGETVGVVPSADLASHDVSVTTELQLAIQTFVSGFALCQQSRPFARLDGRANRFALSISTPIAGLSSRLTLLSL